MAFLFLLPVKRLENFLIDPELIHNTYPPPGFAYYIDRVYRKV